MPLIDTYNIVTDLAKKDQRGYVSFLEFTRIYNQAQNDLLLELLGNYKEYQPSLSIATKAPAKSQYLLDALSPFDKAAIIQVPANGVVTPPVDYMQFQAMYATNPKLSNSQCEDLPRGVVRAAPIVVKRHHEIAVALRSKRYSPTSAYPLAEQIGDEFIVYPTDIGRIQFYYYSKPRQVNLGSTIVGTREVYNPATTVEPEWNDREQKQIMKKILTYIGVNIDNVDLQQFGFEKDNRGV